MCIILQMKLKSHLLKNLSDRLNYACLLCHVSAVSRVCHVTCLLNCVSARVYSLLNDNNKLARSKKMMSTK